MVAQSAGNANRDLTWPALTGKRELRGGDGIGRHVACWIAEQLGYVVVSMVPIARAEGRKQPYEKWGDAKPGREAGEASEFRSPFEIMRARYFRTRCGVGILAGKSGLVVIDIDDEDSWDEFCAGRDMPRTMALDTHSGRQLIFHDETGISFKTQESQLASGVDVRGRGGLFVVYDPGQPERHFTDLTEPAELPDWLREAIPRAGTRGHRKGKGSSTRSRVTETDIKKLSEEVIPPGQHHGWLRSTALSLANKGFTVRNRQDWYMIATAALSRSNECTDAKGHIDRERFPDEDIMAYFDTALEIVASEQRKSRENPGRNYRGMEGLTQSFADIVEEEVNWVWERYIARGFLTQLDGEKAQAKTFVIADIIARATTGRAMPGEEEAICDPVDVFYLAEDVPSIIRKRLRAAGADLSRVHLPHPDYIEAIIRAKEAEVKGSGLIADEEDFRLLLPDGADVMLGMIEQSGAAMAIWDPITDYLHEDIKTGIDASVRRALDPIARGMENLGVAGVSIRHMNKDPKAAARHRGGGSTAFQNRARVHLVTGRLVSEYSECGTFGLSMVDNNFTRSVRGTLTFDVVDSDIKLDNRGNMIGMVEWHDLEEDISADMLTRGSDGDGSGSSKPGPAPEKRSAVIRILDEMGKLKSTWDSEEAKRHIADELEKQGVESVNPRTVDNARRKSMIRTESRKGEVGKNDWIWPAQRAPRQRVLYVTR